MRPFKHYLTEALLSEGTPMSKTLQNIFFIFTQSYRQSKDMRFLRSPVMRKQVCDLIETIEPCDKTLYRYTYGDYGNIPTTKVGHTCYEPMLSTTETEDWVDNKLYQLAGHDYWEKQKGFLPKDLVYCKIVFLPGTKSIDIADYSGYPEQKEWVACGKFKVVDVKEEKLEGKTMGGAPVPFTKRTIIVEQVFDEPIEEIFEKLLPLRDSKKYDDSRDAESASNTNQIDQDDRQRIVDILKRYSKKSISAAEVDRAEKKGISVDYDFLRDLLSRRIFNNVKAYISGLTYDEMVKIAKENSIKITGNKKYGFPEIEFADNI